MPWISKYQTYLSESEKMNNAQMVANHFVGTDWTKESLAALIGNMSHESTLNPDLYEFGYDWSADRGYGLVQWTPRSKYWNWATAQGLEPRSGDSQLARIDYEVSNNIQWIAKSSYGGMTFAQFRQNSGGWSVDYLTEAFTWSYERPATWAGNESMPARKAFANKCLAELDWTGTGEGGGGGVGSKPAFPTEAGLQITDTYGWRTNPVTGEYKFHAAIDIGGGGSTHPLYATQDGIIVYNGAVTNAGYGIRIQHTGDPYFSQYLHLDNPSPIPEGTAVTKGQEIGTMGNGGNSTGIHLDFSIATRLDGFFSEDGTIDPEEYLQMTFGGGGGGGGEDGNEKDTKKEIVQLLLSDALNGWRF